MKSIELKEYSDGAFKNSTENILTQIIDFSKSGNITTTDQRKRIKLLDKIEDQRESGKLDLEEDEFKNLKDLIENMIWAVSNKIIRQFLTDIDGL